MNKVLTVILSLVFIVEMILSVTHFFEVSYLPAIYHMLLSILLYNMINRSILIDEIKAMGSLVTKIKSEITAKE